MIMKRIYGIVAFVVSVLSFVSCDDFMDVHKEYIEDGEIIYAPKPDTIGFIAGKIGFCLTVVLIMLRMFGLLIYIGMMD